LRTLGSCARAVASPRSQVIVASDYQLVSTYLDLAEPFEPETLFSNAGLDPSVKMPE